MTKYITWIIVLGFSLSLNAQNTKMNKSNPLSCDPVTGACTVPGQDNQNANNEPSLEGVDINKPLKITYFTDPICSSCWGVEPQLRKLKLEYGLTYEIEYKMGGLLPDWSYNSGGISKPSDVAHHWDEVSPHYQMPIDGDIWLEDPLDSSYPPSMAYKAAQLQGEKKAKLFLREIKEMVFLHKKNITKWEHLKDAAEFAGLDTAKFKEDFEKSGKKLLDQDLHTARSMGVRGFPSIFIENQTGERFMIYGARPYDTYVKAIETLLPDVQKQDYPTDWKSLYQIHHSYTAREFAELSNISISDAKVILKKLVNEGKLTEHSTKNGSIWTIVD